MCSALLCDSVSCLRLRFLAEGELCASYSLSVCTNGLQARPQRNQDASQDRRSTRQLTEIPNTATSWNSGPGRNKSIPKDLSSVHIYRSDSPHNRRVPLCGSDDLPAGAGSGSPQWPTPRRGRRPRTREGLHKGRMKSRSASIFFKPEINPDSNQREKVQVRIVAGTKKMERVPHGGVISRSPPLI